MQINVHAKRGADISLPFLHLALIALLGVTCYVNSCQNSFVWDDRSIVVNNPLVRAAAWGRIFIGDIANTGFIKTLYYRPLQVATYIADHAIWGMNPFGYHLTNIALHVINAILVYFLSLKIAKNKTISFLTALFFVSHPLSVPVVAYISGRADSLYTFFFFISFLYFIKLKETPRAPYLLISAVSFTLALLSKEAALASIFIFVLYDFILKRSGEKGASRKHLLFPYAFFTAIVIIYAWLRFSHLREALTMAFPASELYSRVLTFPVIVMRYLANLMLPLGLYMRKEFPAEQSICNGKVLISAISLLAVLSAGFLLRKKNKPASFFILYFIAMLIPISNLAVKLNAPEASHWLYAPSVGFFFILALGLFKAQGKWITHVAAAALLMFYSASTVRENSRWKDDITLFSWILENKPNDLVVKGNLTMAYLAESRFCDAEKEGEKLVKSFPNYAIGYYNIGRIYFETGRFNEALKSFKEACAKDASFAEPHLCMGLLYKKNKEFPSAENEFREFTRLEPYSGQGYLNTGILKYFQNKKDEALRFFHDAYDKDPYDARACLYLSTIYREKGEHERSLKLLEKAARLAPSEVNILMNLGNTYNNFGLPDKAIKCFKKAIAISPNMAELYYNMAYSYVIKNDSETARKMRERALEINPALEDR